MDGQRKGNVCNGVPERRSVVLVSEAHGQQILSVLRGFRSRGVLFDFSICIQNETLPCHRCVLAACSDFFRAMFEVNMRERDDGTVTLSNLSAPAVRTFLDFAYSGEIEIVEENVDMLFQLASFLQVGTLSRACSDFLIQTLDLSNCLHLLAIAEGYGSPHLLRRSTEFVMANFYMLSCSSDFLEMPAQVLERCLSADSLSIPDEESALRSLLRWIKHDPLKRSQMLSEFLTLVRLHQLPPALLEEVGRSEHLLLNDQQCSQKIKEAFEQAKKFSGLFPDARPSTTSSYIFVHKTEEDGLTRHAFCYDVEADRWRELPQDAARLADLPGSSLAGFAEKLFVTGGCRGNCCRTVRLHIAEPHHEATNEVWCYCPVTGSLVQAPAMRKDRTMHASVCTLRRLYVIGGKTCGPSHNVQSLPDVEYYDPLLRSWKSVSPLPRRIYFPEVAACGSIVYALGSELEMSEAFNPSLDCFFRYDAIADQWCQLVAEFGQFFHATLVKAVAINETLYLCDLSTYKVYSFCPETCVWKGEGSFECAGFNAGAIGVRDRIYILGGDYSLDEVTDEVQVYHSGRSEWEEVASMPRALTEFHCQALSFNRYRDPWRSEQTETL
uniref:Kelch repeat and BTB domain containing 3 n=1 Tax=Astyanax mexicanus TaxID=7994 RepID=A0A3B1JPF5_ASTMX